MRWPYYAVQNYSIADEPTTALDVTVQAQIMTLLNELKREFNTAIIMITHDLGVVAGICDQVMVMYAGRTMEYGTAEQIFYHPTPSLFYWLNGCDSSFRWQ